MYLIHCNVSDTLSNFLYWLYLTCYNEKLAHRKFRIVLNIAYQYLIGTYKFANVFLY